MTTKTKFEQDYERHIESINHDGRVIGLVCGLGALALLALGLFV